MSLLFFHEFIFKTHTLSFSSHNQLHSEVSLSLFFNVHDNEVNFTHFHSLSTVHSILMPSLFAFLRLCILPLVMKDQHILSSPSSSSPHHWKDPHDKQWLVPTTMIRTIKTNKQQNKKKHEKNERLMTRTNFCLKITVSSPLVFTVIVSNFQTNHSWNT